ncbi:hypothetical protein B566_EDAN012286 [Ephemera danica]|nr:hypothetical protein B566_EDAN012286 [Ephemera danica]
MWSHPADSKRKASEYFCVAQCLGLLNAGGAPPGSASCYSGPLAGAASTGGLGLQCLSANFQAGNYDKCKTIMPPPMKMFLGYVINSGLEPSTYKFDVTNADTSAMVRIFGKQMMNPDGSINYDAAKSAMMSAVPDAWKCALQLQLPPGTVSNGTVTSEDAILSKYKKKH